MKKKRSQKPKIDNWHFKKASQLRSSWRVRAKKNNIPLDSIPTRIEIQSWLELNTPPRCYITNSILSYLVIEIDHKIPITRGGNFSFENLGITSRYFNNIKGSMTEDEFRQLFQLVSTWEDKGKSLFNRLLSSNTIYKRKK